ncbi:LysR family transcriptional regulator [Klebsiella aerogenes]|uniref:LysR family transcriptional regulator n=2 Tax=Klebsiella aerogenes TaxID=548 RepID=UPI000DA258B6|nr:LysR family transcriptional regulator [Klebsiella aerogenes]HCB2860443.1 LysR family transcriptional regulator [Klebsiella aerogenes]HCB2864780.1 LysR family transcriptional regulator [Klebsiella aerogenes]HCB2881606.1 LysR family transcriptional regulator [Klebsiella aerogenes]HCB3345843.1 LysR family transcriptional regulator [Klebsiella aerogenes]HCM1812511.1 LysR family transcriptional regulator [Klebsiella aerogenes]
MHNLDMKTLRVLDTLMNCGSVTRSAEYLDVTPGAVSYFLNKARQSTGSALFFRTKNGMQPDNVARELVQQYQHIQSEKTRNNNKPTSLRGLTISTYALIELLIGTATGTQNLKHKINFHPLPIDGDERQQKLRNKEVDIDIGTRLPADSNIIQCRLFSCGIRIVTGQQCSIEKNCFTLDDWLKASHIVWGRGMPLFHDNHEHANRFHEYLSHRRVACIASNSINMIFMAAHSNHIVMMPEKIVNSLKDKYPVRVFTPPPELNMLYECFLHYHKALAGDANIQSMLKKIYQIFQ